MMTHIDLVQSCLIKIITIYKKKTQHHKLFLSKIEALQVMTSKTHFHHVNIFFEKVNTTVMCTEISGLSMKGAPVLPVDPFTFQKCPSNFEG